MAQQIFGLISQAMKKVDAVGKDSVNEQQKYKFRGIDAVYNALNPVMSELGLFICPEIIEHRREERVSESTYNNQTKKTVLKYSILTIKYTVYAPDGSSVSCTVVGEGMDSGDKASNKAMSVAMKYAMFQLLMIPTEEMVDPDVETHVVTSSAITPSAPTQPEAVVERVPQLPDKCDNPVLIFLANERETLRKVWGMTKAENNTLWNTQVKVLQESGVIPKKPVAEFTQDEAAHMVQAMYKNFTPTGTVLKDDWETA